jgi:hypothetical protein
MGGEGSPGARKWITGELVKVGMTDWVIRVMVSRVNGDVCFSFASHSNGPFVGGGRGRPLFRPQEIPAFSPALERPTTRFRWTGVKTASCGELGWRSGSTRETWMTVLRESMGCLLSAEHSFIQPEDAEWLELLRERCFMDLKSLKTKLGGGERTIDKAMDQHERSIHNRPEKSQAVIHDFMLGTPPSLIGLELMTRDFAGGGLLCQRRDVRAPGCGVDLGGQAATLLRERKNLSEQLCKRGLLASAAHVVMASSSTPRDSRRSTPPRRSRARGTRITRSPA